MLSWKTIPCKLGGAELKAGVSSCLMLDDWDSLRIPLSITSKLVVTCKISMWWIFVKIWTNKIQYIAYFQLHILFKSCNWFICSLIFINLTIWLHQIDLCSFCHPIKIRNFFSAFSLQNVSFPSAEKKFGQDGEAIPNLKVV